MKITVTPPVPPKPIYTLECSEAELRAIYGCVAGSSQAGVRNALIAEHIEGGVADIYGLWIQIQRYLK